MEATAYDIWLSGIPGIGPKKIERILSFCQSARDFYNMKEKDLRSIYGISEKDVSAILEERRKTDPERLLKDLERKGVKVKKKGEEGYPKGLLELPDPPYLLFYKGRLPEPGKGAVGIVGARECSEYGRAMARTAGKLLGAGGISVISGMALGIDAAAHLGALEGGGETFAVLGSGPDICYPNASRNLYERLLKEGGVLSEYVPGTEPKAQHFPLRNRIISALSDALVVVEARIRSGALITADFALEQGKDIYAFPGRITDALSGGTNRLIRQGAYPVVSLDGLLSDLRLGTEKIAEKAEAQKNTLAFDEMVVYSCLNFVPKNLEELMEETNLPLPALSEALFALMKKGLCVEAFQNRYRREIE